ncbi:uncharacterized protein LOC115623409 [Scaptodrosophila lebanonensis]|uniref:Mediator of RNA polymerase II transcription subunit 19 n=1 Tax=Drosophila lebanonensis TaxID=7225 RepID=A0A6J2TC34_DROLE|nr:uncharacterized protein LOC115623409 [Scaptodrosophila lebanonensis]
MVLDTSAIDALLTLPTDKDVSGSVTLPSNARESLYVTPPIDVKCNFEHKLEEFDKYLREQRKYAADPEKPLSAFLPKSIYHDIDQKTENSTLESVLGTIQPCQKQLHALTRKELHGFRLCAGMIPTKYCTNISLAATTVLPDPPQRTQDFTPGVVRTLKRCSKTCSKSKGQKKGHQGRSRKNLQLYK